MLKFAKTAALVLTASFAINATAHASVEEALANICTIVSADDKGELRKKMRSVQSDYRLKLHDYYTGITCDGQSLIRTAITSNAVEVGTLLVKKMPSRDLTVQENDGKTLQAWINENGLQDHAIAKELMARL
ncbi:DUF3718 domain-containing protein [Alteromonas lipolytica]|uniref:DUF3718 domain-containing protein n=1 Tax=Alteromonas lipolytica TaxID=1856405 RepID=A0A1E8FG47_9ALTE|nr:DUF3718 domain-containing protein [Alteromonas lipolytica]OFI34900.1 hypothetical protein BFC17_15130 [Alteromonas lipolytica]GGF54941.1 hypothetical protein GCM10011338_03950 [Alteromonas lipolytica]